MTPKEKAKELVDKFIMYDVQVCDLMGDELEGYEENHYRNCALICVDEILDVVNPLTLEYEYWEEVEQEINKL